MTTCRVRTKQNASRQIGANPNSISFGGGIDPCACERRFMFAKCAMWGNVARWSAGGKNRQSSGFSRGRLCEFVGTPTRGGTVRETALWTSLYFWTGECRRDAAEAEGPQDWCILLLELSPRVLRSPVPLLPLFPPPIFSALFLVLFAPPRPATVILQRRQVYRLFTLVSSKTATAELFYGARFAEARFGCTLTVNYDRVTCACMDLASRR